MSWSNLKPDKKVELPAFAGALATVGWWAADYWANVEAPSAVVAASVVILAAVVGWFAPRRS